MSKLTVRLRKIVGKGRSGFGRGMAWLYVGYEATSIEEKMSTVKKLVEEFEGFKLTSSNNTTYPVYVFKVDNLGSCKIQLHDGFTVLGYSEVEWLAIESSGDEWVKLNDQVRSKTNFKKGELI